MAIKLISFDLDDTLWAVGPVMVQANLCLYQWLQQHAPRFSQRYALEDFGRLREQVVKQHPEIAHSVTAVRLAVLQQGLSNSGYNEADTQALAKAAFDVFLVARNQVELFQHAQQMLSELSTHYRLAALSNGNADINLVGLGRYFEFSFNADQLGQAKPHPLMFEHMLEQAQVDATQTIHIGDHPEHDIAGAQNCGLHTLWVNFANSPWLGTQTPDLQVNCLSEVVTAIEHYQG